MYHTPASKLTPIDIESVRLQVVDTSIQSPAGVELMDEIEDEYYKLVKN